MARNKMNSGARQVHTGADTSTGMIPTAENPNPQFGAARNTIVERAIDPMGDGKLTPAPMKGGSYGVIPEAEKRVHFHAGTAIRKDAAIARKPKTFIVVDGPRNAAGKITFMYDHQRVAVSYGKEVTETTYDLDLLRRQGLRLEEVVDPLGDAQQAQLQEVVAQAPQGDGEGDDIGTDDEDDDKE